MSDLEIQQEIIKMCNKIYQHYSEQVEKNRKIDWEEWWGKTEPYMDSHYSEENVGMSNYRFMQYRFLDVFRELKVIEGDNLWPIKK